MCSWVRLGFDSYPVTVFDDRELYPKDLGMGSVFRSRYNTEVRGSFAFGYKRMVGYPASEKQSIGI